MWIYTRVQERAPALVGMFDRQLFTYRTIVYFWGQVPFVFAELIEECTVEVRTGRGLSLSISTTGARLF